MPSAHIYVCAVLDLGFDQGGGIWQLGGGVF